MAIATNCPNCQAKFRLPDELAGRRVKCQNCGDVFRAPTDEAAPPAVQEEVGRETLAAEADVPQRAERAIGAASRPAPSEDWDDEEDVPRRRYDEERRTPRRSMHSRSQGSTDPWVIVGIVGGVLVVVGMVIAAIVMVSDRPAMVGPKGIIAMKPPPIPQQQPFPFQQPPQFPFQKPEDFIEMGGMPPPFFPQPDLKIVPLDWAKATRIDLEKGWYENLYRLARNDPRDPVMRQPCKLFVVPFEAGKTYVIDQMAPRAHFDSYLRLEDPQGKQLAADDDRGGYPNARIQHTAQATGAYRVIATSLSGGEGGFTLAIRDLAVAAPAPKQPPLETKKGGMAMVAAPDAKGVRQIFVTAANRQAQLPDRLDAAGEFRQYSFVAEAKVNYAISVLAQEFVPRLKFFSLKGDQLQDVRGQPGSNDMHFVFQSANAELIHFHVAADDKKAGLFTLTLRR